MGAPSLAWGAAPRVRAASCTKPIRRRQCRRPHDGADWRRQERLRAKYDWDDRDDRNDRGRCLAAVRVAAVGDGGAQTRPRLRRYGRRHGHLAQGRADACIGQVHARPSGQQRRRSRRCAAAARIGHPRRLDIEDGPDNSRGHSARRGRCAESGCGDRGDRVRSGGNAGHDDHRDRRRPSGSLSRSHAGSRSRSRNRHGARDSGRHGDSNRRVAPRHAAGGNCAIGAINAVRSARERADASAASASRGYRRGVVLSAEPAAARVHSGPSTGWRADLAPGGMEHIAAIIRRERAAIRPDDGASGGRRRDGTRVFGREPRQVRSGGSGRARGLAGLGRSDTRRGRAPQRVLAVDDGLR